MIDEEKLERYCIIFCIIIFVAFIFFISNKYFDKESSELNDSCQSKCSELNDSCQSKCSNLNYTYYKYYLDDRCGTAGCYCYNKDNEVIRLK